MNLKFEIAYDGSTFFGSQKQANKNTVEDELLKAFKNINIDTETKNTDFINNIKNKLVF